MQVGDHLVSPRVGYTHHGLYVGNNEVIHYEGKIGEGNGHIAQTSLQAFCDGQSCTVRDYPIRVYGRKESVSRALGRLGEQDYNVIFNNCEQFVAWCIMGLGYSEQINTVMSDVFQAKLLIELQSIKSTATHLTQSVVEDSVRQVATAVVPTGAALVTGSAISGSTVALASGLSIASITPLALPIAAGAIVGYGIKKLIDWVW